MTEPPGTSWEEVSLRGRTSAHTTSSGSGFRSIRFNSAAVTPFGVLGSPPISSIFLLVILAQFGCHPPPTDPINFEEKVAHFDQAPPPKDPGVRSRTLPLGLPTDDPPRFLGIAQLIAADRSLYISWVPAIDHKTPTPQIRYRVYLSEKRQDEEKFSRPPALETEPGQTRVHLQNLTNGTPLFVVVRAVDEGNDGVPGNADDFEDDNELEWSTIPNPVLYVQSGVNPPGDGTRPETPLPDLHSAISAAIPMESGANIYLSAGDYKETALLLLFEGMMVFGGFERGFPSPFSFPRQHRTRFLSEVQEDVITLVPGQRLCGIDGVEFQGRDLDRNSVGSRKTERAIVAEDCEFRISNCEIHGFRDKGIKLRSELKQDAITIGEISRCWIYDNTNSGIDMEGIFDVSIVGCAIYQNESGHGIELGELTATAREKSRIVVEGCRIYENLNGGIKIKAIALPGGLSEDSRIRIKIRSCEIVDNFDTGILVDVAYADAIGIDMRVRIEQCRIQGNKRSGIRLDGDARGHFQLTRNMILGNRGEAGIYLTGDCPAALYQIQSSAIIANENHGILLESSGHASLDHTHFAANGKMAFHRAGAAWIRVEDSLLNENGAVATADLIDHCVVSDERQLLASSGTVAPAATRGFPWGLHLPLQTLRLDAENLQQGWQELEPGTIVEWLDDGTPRRVIEREGVRVLIPPLPESSSAGVPVLFVWGVQQQPDVVEDYRPPVGTPLYEAGNPTEQQVDGSAAHIGPMGAFFAGHPGIDRGGPPPSRGLELSWIDPPSGSYIQELTWKLFFTGSMVVPEEFRARVYLDEVELTNVTIKTDGREVRVSSDLQVSAGQEVSLVIPPWPATAGGRPQPLDHSFVYRGAYPIVDELDRPRVTAVPSTGEIIFPELRPVRVPLVITSVKGLRLQLLPLLPVGGAGWRIRIVTRDSGTPVLDVTQEPLQLIGSPGLQGNLQWQTPPIQAGTEWDLELTPPGGPSFDSDGAARLLVVE